MTNQIIEGGAAKHANISNPGGASSGEIALFSIAISLKRIADCLEGSPNEYGIKNILSDISEKTNRG